MERKDGYKLKESFKNADEADQRKAYADLLEEYNQLVQITEAFIRMTRAIPSY